MTYWSHHWAYPAEDGHSSHNYGASLHQPTTAPLMQPLQFDPANISKPSLENGILTAALACEDVLVVAREGTGLALVGKLTPQRECSIGFQGEPGKMTTTDIDQSTLFIKREVHGAARIVAGRTSRPGR